ncbi:O-antigen ligase family protein [Blastopirellula marina]|uniref:O-antigen ligase-related domain-containing protein n=1 Tax=Blastopirellula marina TaxID=124 RepID=A0A2S8GEH6_9BACT|nr:O-antigen ligase family protein [Blastopirellula marina]PQO42857.1 hypothetical protein C5Y98_01515 [Blastopirellula marina]PTL46623.1 O-antigen ligase domain-containing protein [Blastopirellula marina]
MAAKNKREKQVPQPEPSILDSLIGGGIALLAVATPLVASEGSPERGAELWLAVGWCLLLVLWGVRAIAQPKLEIRWSWIESCLAAFLAWLALSTWMVAGEGNLRAAFNGFWDYAHLLVAYFLIRQWIVTDRQRHALLTSMIGLAVLVSAYSLYQYQEIIPANRAAYYENPEKILAENGIETTEGNPVRTLFEARLNSTEPTGTFTLTNSLAAFLVPWFLLSVGWLKNAYAAPIDWKRVGGLTLAIVLVGLCLVLTKSRTSWLTALFGLGLIAFYGSAIGKRVSWVIPAATLGAFLVLFMLAFVTGVLDVEVLSEAPTSVLYRLQYWQGAAEIIAHHPIFGCGLANFQGYYPEYMLPMASETVADPHNLVFEVWASAGTPALLLLVAAMVFWARQIGFTSPADEAELAGNSKDVGQELSDRPIWFGALLAPFVAPFLQMIMQEVMLDFTPLMIGIVPALIVVGVLAQTTITRDLRLWLVIAVAAMVINLMAAGGISYPSVGGSLFLLAAVALPSQKVVVWEDLKPKAAGLLIGLAGLIVVSYWGIQPVANRQKQIALAMDAARRGDWLRMEQHAQLATSADPWSKDGPAMLANVYFQGWMNNPDAPVEPRQMLLEKFQNALDEQFNRAGHSFPLHFSAGDWFLDMYRQSGNPEFLLEALDHYRATVRLYPNRAIHHAQLAWALHLADMPQESAAEAEEALRLDELNPHAERRLEILKIHDMPIGKGDAQEVPPPEAELSAKQVVEKLRTITN